MFSPCYRLAPRALTAPLAHANVNAVPSRSHTGYIPFEGRFRDWNNDAFDLTQQYQRLNLQPVSRVHFRFDPFRQDVASIRTAMTIFSRKKVRDTNLKCLFRTDVLSGCQEEHTMKVELNDEQGQGRILVFKTAQLSALEILNEYNKITLPLVIDENELEAAAKAAKTAAGGAAKGKGKARKGKK